MMALIPDVKLDTVVKQMVRLNKDVVTLDQIPGCGGWWSY